MACFSFPQDVLAQEQSDNLFLPTHPPLRTAVPMLALEAPRAHLPAAWLENVVFSPSRATILLQIYLYGFCASSSSSSFFKSVPQKHLLHSYFFRFSFKKHNTYLWHNTSETDVIWELVIGGGEG